MIINLETEKERKCWDQSIYIINNRLTPQVEQQDITFKWNGVESCFTLCWDLAPGISRQFICRIVGKIPHQIGYEAQNSTIYTMDKSQLVVVLATWNIRSRNWSITIANALTLVSFLVKRCHSNKGRSKEHLFLLQQATIKKLNSEATFLSPRHLLQKQRMIPDEIRWRLTSALSHHLSACFPDFTML